MSAGSWPEPTAAGTPLRCAAAAAGVLAFFTGLDNYAFAFWKGPKPLYLVLLFVAAAAVLLLCNLRAPARLLRSPLLAWAALYFLITTLWAIVARGSSIVQLELDTRYRSMAFLVAFAFLFEEARSRRIAALTVAAAVVFASLLNVLELFGVVEFAKQEELRVGGRAAGLYINANGAALAIVFGLGVAMASIPRKWRIPLLLVGAAGVAATFSRGGELCLAALTLGLVWRKELPVWPMALALLLIAVYLSAHSSGVLAYLFRSRALNEETMARMLFEHDDSGRAQLALRAWHMFLDAPLWGNGLASTFGWREVNSSHNQFLNLAADHGIVGLLTFPALAVALVLNDRGALPFALALMMAGLFSHNLLEDRATLLAIALAGAAVAPATAVETPEAPADQLENAPSGAS